MCLYLLSPDVVKSQISDTEEFSVFLLLDHNCVLFSLCYNNKLLALFLCIYKSKC